MQRLVLLLCTLLCMTTVGSSQNKNYDWGVSFKALFMDYQSQNGGSIDAIRNYHHGFEIGLHRKIQDNINLVVPIKYGLVDATDRPEGSFIHKSILGLDATVQYQFQKDDAIIVPYFLGGLGIAAEFEGDLNVQAPIGGGIYFKAAPNAYVNWQSEYRFSFAENRNNLHHSIGFVYMLGKQDMEMPEKVEEKDPDMDGDGTPDALDLCPDLPGPEALNGCPDSDGDGIPDFQDKCPNSVGPKTTKGCPDSDGDGISDDEDKCPQLAGNKDNDGCPGSDRDNDGIEDSKDACPDMAGPAPTGCPDDDNDMDGVPNSIDRCPDAKGTAATNGCPDSDGDGVADPDDKCPNAFGPKVYNGCPDTDGDGLDDSRDRCPTIPGTVAEGGCPEIDKEDKETLDIAMRAVQFDTGKNTLKSESFQILRQIASILKRYPAYNLSIAGHTDDVGNPSSNQVLSEKRAKACYDYLVSQGIARDRMSHTGYGDSRPIADNKTLNGKRLNRRVEFTLVPR